jgi:serine/threonine protein kinase
MGDSTNSTRGVPPRSGSAGSSAAGGPRETLLLSDIADRRPAQESAPSPLRETLHEPTPAAPPSTRAIFGLDSSVLASLGQRYEILSEAGHGSMGNVYKARDRETGETVALKLLKPEIASDQAMMERFKNELLYARKITHKNVCRVYEFNRAGGVAYTSMEFVEGESLRSALNRFGAFSQKKATDLALQICSGLKEAHAQGIVHRDLKPENVMIDGSGNLKLMDFGIARSMEAVTRLTGAMVGTPAYMAPEQVSGSPVDYRTDIYSLGLMLYEMFTGRPAFSAENAIAVALKQMREEPPRPGEIEPSIPLPVERAILKCLEKSPEKRFQNVGALESALQAHAQAGTNTQPVVPQEVRRGLHAARAHPARVATEGRTAAWWAVLAALLVVSCGAAGWYWRSAMNSAANIPAPAALPAPVPPDFAYEIPVVTPGAPVVATEDSEPRKVTTAKPGVPHTPPNETHLKTSTPEVFPRMETGPDRRSLPDPSKWIAAQRARAQQQKPKQTGLIYLKTGRFFQEQKAQDEVKKIKALGLPGKVSARHGAGHDYYLALCGPIAVGGAKAVTQQLNADGFTTIEKVSAASVQ